MKNIIYLICLCFSFYSCSSDDRSTEIVIESDQLVLTASKSDIFVNDEVTFIVKDSDAQIVDATLLIDGQVIKSPFSFDKDGVFTVIAKKEGYKDSNSYKVKVDLKSLRLEVDLQEVIEKKPISFVVYWGKEIITNDIEVIEITTNQVVEKGTFISEIKGEFKFVARGKGYSDSNEITVNVIERDRRNKIIFRDEDYRIGEVSMGIVGNYFTDPETNRSIFVEDIIEVEENIFANAYTLLFKNVLDGRLNRVMLTFFVVNETIIGKDSKIIDKGKRIIPNANSRIIYNDFWLSLGMTQFLATSNDSSLELVIKSIDVPNNGVNAGANGVLGKIEMTLSFQDYEDQYNVTLEYSGDMKFSDSTFNMY